MADGGTKLERRNPLPPGTYWQDVFEPKWPVLDAWLTKNRATVRVRTVQKFDANAGGPARQFVVFEVTAPTQWPAVDLGFPTVATSGAVTSEDTVQRPPPEATGFDALANLKNPIDSLSSGLLWGGAAAALGIGIYALTRP